MCVPLLYALLWNCIAGEWGYCLSICICSLRFRQLAPLSRYTWSISTWQLCTLNKKVAAFSARTIYTGLRITQFMCALCSLALAFQTVGLATALFDINFSNFAILVERSRLMHNLHISSFWTSWVDRLIVMIQLFRLSRFLTYAFNKTKHWFDFIT